MWAAQTEEVLSFGFGNFLSSVPHCGSRNRDSQTLGGDGKSESGGPARPQCHQPANRLTEHPLCASGCSGGWGAYDQDAEQDLSIALGEGGGQGDRRWDARVSTFGGSWRGWFAGLAWENQERFWGRGGVLKEDERELADDHRAE